MSVFENLNHSNWDLAIYYKLLSYMLKVSNATFRVALSLFKWLRTSNCLLGSIRLFSVSYMNFLKTSWTFYNFLPFLCSARYTDNKDDKPICLFSHDMVNIIFEGIFSIYSQIASAFSSDPSCNIFPKFGIGCIWYVLLTDSINLELMFSAFLYSIW